MSYKELMTRVLLLWLALTTAGAASAALLQAGAFTLGNQTGQPLGSIAIREFGAGSWRELTGSLAPGVRQPIAFSNDDCAFDIRGTLPGGQVVTWSGVNLCDVRAVTLNRRADGTIWVDYD